MAKCRLCKIDIPDEIEYCENCRDKKDVKTKESYLDSLLNSVQNTDSPVSNAFKRKDKWVDDENSVSNHSMQNNDFPAMNSDSHNEVLDDEVFEDNTFVEYNSLHEDYNSLHEDDNSLHEDDNSLHEDYNSLHEDDNSLHEEDYSHDFNIDGIGFEDLEDFLNYDMNDDLEDSIVIGDDELFGMVDTLEYTTSHEVDESITDQTEDEIVSAAQVYDHDENFSMEDVAEVTEDPFIAEELTEELIIEDNSINELIPQMDQMDNSSETDTMNSDSQYQPEENVDHEFMLNSLLPDNYNLEEEFDPSIGELLSGIDFLENDSIPENDQNLLYNDSPSEPDQPEQDADPQSEEEDLLSLLSQFSSDDPIAADVQAISDMLNGKSPINQLGQDALPSDVGEVFSNTLKAVTTLNDPESDEAIFDALASDKQDKKTKKKKVRPEKVKKAKSKKSKEAEPKATHVNGESFLSRLFSNVVDEKAAEQKSLQEAAAAIAPDNKSKKSKKKKKGATVVSQTNEDGLERARPENENQEDTKAKKKEKKIKEKKPKKDKKVIEVIDDYDEDITRINPIGASIVFVFFGILVLILLIGTNIFSYSLSIKNAKTYFSRQDYTQAYNEVYGVDIKDEDIEIYDKIMTVMFVNKQLNSYNNYYAMEKYPEALDSLLKGLSRYEKYIELATMLGIKSDLDYVRKQILAELDNEFSLTEKEAYFIINSDNQMEYSIAVYDIVLENMKYYR